MREPQIHTSITDKLPDDHPRAWRTIMCDYAGCKLALHSIPNENMNPWVETGLGNFCFAHFFTLYDQWEESGAGTRPIDGLLRVLDPTMTAGVPEDAWGLPE